MRGRSSPLLLGALAGIAGAAAMTGAMRMLHQRLPPGERYALPPREIVQGALPTQGEPTLAEPDRQRLTVAGHFGYGAAMGSLLAAVRPSSGVAAGAAYGVLVWAGSYLGLLPALGVLKPATRHPLSRNLLMVGAHLVWGATTAITLRELERAEAEIFVGTEAPDVRQAD